MFSNLFHRNYKIYNCIRKRRFYLIFERVLALKQVMSDKWLTFVSYFTISFIYMFRRVHHPRKVDERIVKKRVCCSFYNKYNAKILFKVSCKLWLILCSRRRLKANLNIVINLPPYGLDLWNFVRWRSCKLQNVFFEFASSVSKRWTFSFHSMMVDGTKGSLKNSYFKHIKGGFSLHLAWNTSLQAGVNRVKKLGACLLKTLLKHQGFLFPTQLKRLYI